MQNTRSAWLIWPQSRFVFLVLVQAILGKGTQASVGSVAEVPENPIELCKKTKGRKRLKKEGEKGFV